MSGVAGLLYDPEDVGETQANNGQPVTWLFCIFICSLERVRRATEDAK